MSDPKPRGQFRPMLCARKATLQDVVLPAYLSVKMDGVRCLVRDGGPKSLELNECPNRFTRRELSSTLLEGIDSEYIVGKPNLPSTYHTSNSAWGSIEGEPDFKIYAIDDFTDPDLPFEERLKKLTKRIRDLNNPRVVLAPQKRVTTLREVKTFYRTCLSLNFEGMVSASPLGPYKYGRSTIRENYRLKFKEISHSEAEILDIVQGSRNNNPSVVNPLGYKRKSSAIEGLIPSNMMGKLLVRDIHSGVQFFIGSGTLFTNRFREDCLRNFPKYKGRILRYHSITAGVKDKPRHAQADGFRDECIPDPSVD